MPKTAEHNHDHCIHSALLAAERLCSERGARLTAQRREVLELVWQSHKPVGAYELMDLMRGKVQKPVAPPTVYRALDFLIEQGLVHRLASINAFIGCVSPDQHHSGQFLICKQCGYTTELPDRAVAAQIDREAELLGFRVEARFIEVVGLCPACQQTAAN